MKLYTQKQVEELLETQRGNCYVAVLGETKDTKIASLATKAPLPGGDKFERYYDGGYKFNFYNAFSNIRDVKYKNYSIFYYRLM